MFHAIRPALLAVIASLLVAGLCGCDKSGDTPGQKLDRALDKTGEKIKEAGDAIQPR